MRFFLFIFAISIKSDNYCCRNIWESDNNRESNTKKEAVDWIKKYMQYAKKRA